MHQMAQLRNLGMSLRFPSSGLTVELYIEQDEYVAELSENAGVIVNIHDQAVMPFPEDDGVLLAPDMYTWVGITLVRADLCIFTWFKHIFLFNN